MQVEVLVEVLEGMAASQRLPEQGDAAVLTHLQASDLQRTRNAVGQLVVAAKARCSRYGYYKQGLYIVRRQGSPAAKRSDCHHLLSYRRTRPGGLEVQVHGVLCVQELYTIEKGDAVFRVAVGELFEATPIAGAGLDTTFNDDSTAGALRVPTKLKVVPSTVRYTYAVFLSSLVCPLVANESGTQFTRSLSCSIKGM